MKHIVKSDSEESQLFESWKQTWNLTKEDLLNNSLLREQKKEIWEKLSGTNKENLKTALLNEQGFICCYCQQRIELDSKTIIEHFIARDIQPEKMFDYENLFACCDGGDKDRENPNSRRMPLYCDRKKANKTLAVNPLDEYCETHFKYIFNENPEEPEVIIEGISKEGQEAIESLNLNISKFRTLRGLALVNSIFDKINDEYVRISDDDINDLIVVIKQRKTDGWFEPFCVVLDNVLRNMVNNTD